MQTNKEKNTAALLAYYVKRREDITAKHKDDPRELKFQLKVAHDAEWYVLNACLNVPHLYEAHEGMPIAHRLDAMVAEMRADYEASKSRGPK